MKQQIVEIPWAITVAKAAPITPNLNTMIKRKSKPMFKTVEMNKNISGVIESPKILRI